jgi:hypothetical protein
MFTPAPGSTWRRSGQPSPADSVLLTKAEIPVSGSPESDALSGYSSGNLRVDSLEASWYAFIRRQRFRRVQGCSAPRQPEVSGTFDW